MTIGRKSRRLLLRRREYDSPWKTARWFPWRRRSGFELQIIRDWTLRFNADGPDGLRDRKAPGKASILDEIQRQALTAMVEQGPMPAIHGVVRWRLSDLTQWLWEEFRLSVSRQTLGLRAQGYAKLSARPRHHSQDAEAMDTFKKSPRPPGGNHRP